MSWAKRIDNNQRDIVKALRQIPGCTVESLAAVGKGVPDILCGFFNKNYLFEIKDGNKPPSRRKLTPAQVEWHNSWCGQVDIITCLGDALIIIGIEQVTNKDIQDGKNS